MTAAAASAREVIIEPASDQHDPALERHLLQPAESRRRLEGSSGILSRTRIPSPYITDRASGVLHGRVVATA